MSKRSPKASARSAERDATAVMVPPSAHCIASANPVAMLPGPTTPQRIIVRGPPFHSRRFRVLITLSSAAAWANAPGSWRREPSEPRQEDHDPSLHAATGRPLHLRALDGGE